MTDGSHDCPKIGCPEKLPMNTLACRSHWLALPVELRRAIGSAWRNGDLQEHLELRKQAVAILNPTVAQADD